MFETLKELFRVDFVFSERAWVVENWFKIGENLSTKIKITCSGGYDDCTSVYMRKIKRLFLNWFK
jgi:hypothetical protein